MQNMKKVGIMYMATVVNDNGDRTTTVHSSYDKATEYLKNEYSLEDDDIKEIEDNGSFEEDSGFMFFVEEVEYFG